MKPHSLFRKTKIVCTIGPGTNSPEQIRELLKAGMDVARLNFSHGDHESHRRTIAVLRQVSSDLGREIGILQDLGGPKIRLGELNVEERRLQAGERVVLASGEASETDILPVDYPYLAEDVEVGNRILLADGTVELSVTDKQKNLIICSVVAGGALRSHKGVNLPSSKLRIPAFTEKDRKDLAVGLEGHVDFVALSFIRHERDLEPVLEILDKMKRRPMLIAKIEKPQAVDRFEKILAAVDGIMVARGDLGVEMPFEDVPIIQKKIIQLTRQAGKPVITATQMLGSMVASPRPTRAEATDVTNAILDGTDALMLSDETAMGAFPTKAVATLDRIARASEPYLDEERMLNELTSELLPTTAAAISRAACRLARDLGAAAIVASTSSGGTARLVARFRPTCPVIALTSQLQTQRQLTLSWGVIPDLMDSYTHTDQMFNAARAWVREKGIARRGDRLVITAGVPIGVKGTTNLLKVMEISDEQCREQC